MNAVLKMIKANTITGDNIISKKTITRIMWEMPFPNANTTGIITLASERTTTDYKTNRNSMKKKS